jgi:hypothetical protein
MRKIEELENLGKIIKFEIDTAIIWRLEYIRQSLPKHVGFNLVLKPIIWVLKLKYCFHF